MARIYQSPTMGDADVRVVTVTNRGEADLLVHRVSSWGLASGDGLWFLTRDRQDATCRIFMTSHGLAEVRICFVDGMADAGWRRPHRLRGRFG